ncbi:MAG: periplasmic heavy metal sensor [Acidobacteria bacterium]|nr:periplasmic heavy metal sensor [Acidobacteriota bacterium]MBU4308075.1 periplasmic heavy metal sensor [Acidobacteriota bacterium]MCG2812292.1 periplasmic heavy metal sensor [Candidatus Aminicenantes bacterium]
MKNKKFFRVLVLAAFAAMVVIAPLQAAPGCQKKVDPEKMMDKGCMMLKHIPNLSDEQKGKLEKLHAEHQKMMAAVKADMEKQALEMKALMKDPVDIKKIEAKIDEMAKMKAGMQKKCLAQRLAVKALLTDEQKAKFDAMGCGMMHGHGGMMGGCRMKAKDGKGSMKGHGMKMEKGECLKTETEEK